MVLFGQHVLRSNNPEVMQIIALKLTGSLHVGLLLVLCLYLANMLLGPVGSILCTKHLVLCHDLFLVILATVLIRQRPA